MRKPQRIRDPVHDLVEFSGGQFENVLWNAIETRPFQRLRRIKQLGFSDLVFPGATHSRFAHSVGVFHTARQLMTNVRAHLGESGVDEAKMQQALAAALVHDLGHGPFSHSFEQVGKRLSLRMAQHENVSDVLIRDGEVAEALHPLGSGFAADVADIVRAKGPTDVYGAVVSSQFAADRLDYIRRDRLMTGTQHSAIDFRWLMANIKIGEIPYGVDESKVGNKETFVLGEKAVYAAEAYVLGLFQLYPTVYFHKTTRSAEKMFAELLVRIIRLAQDGSHARLGLEANHPLVGFARAPDSLEAVLNLDDTVVWSALAMLSEAEDRIVGDLARRLRDRKLYKAIDVRKRMRWDLQFDDSANQKAMEEEIDLKCESIDEKVKDWISTNSAEGERVLCDETEREPYKRFEESKGPLNQIRIEAPNGRLVDLADRSSVVRAIRPYKLYRLYVAEEDSEAREFVEGLIRKEVGHAAD